MRRSLLPFPLALVLALAAAASAHAGGFATVGLSSTPDGVAPGKPWNVEITVLNPETPLSNGEPRLVILNRSTGESTTYEATPTKEPSR